MSNPKSCFISTTGRATISNISASEVWFLALTLPCGHDLRWKFPGYAEMSGHTQALRAAVIALSVTEGWLEIDKHKRRELEEGDHPPERSPPRGGYVQTHSELIQNVF